MEASKVNKFKQERTRVICPKCRSFIFEIKPYISPLQEVTIFCHRCKQEFDVTHSDMEHVAKDLSKVG